MFKQYLMLALVMTMSLYICVSVLIFFAYNIPVIEHLKCIFFVSGYLRVLMLIYIYEPRQIEIDLMAIF